MIRKILICRAVLLSILFYCNLIFSVSFAAPVLQSTSDLSLYILGQAGYADTHLGNKIISIDEEEGTRIPVIISNSGLAGRIALGLQFNPYFALETGYLNILGNKAYKDHEGILTESRLNLQQTVYDAIVKVSKPFANHFSIYGKAGLAYLTTTLSGRFSKLPLPEYQYITNQARRKWAPEIGLGVTYHLVSKLFFDLSWSHIHPLGINKPGNIDFLAAGFIYYF